MRILHITAEALRGGCEKNCYLFIEGSRHACTHEVMVLGKKGPMSEEWIKQGVSLTHLNILEQNIFSFFVSLRNAVPFTQFDMIICWSTVRLPVQLFCIRKRSDHIRIYLGNPVSTSYQPLKDQILHFVLPVSKPEIVLMACSRYVADSHQQTSYYNCFAIKVSLNPVEVPTVLPEKHFHAPFFNMGMVARLDPIKDHKTVINGFKIVYEQKPEARLHLVGDGRLRQELENQVKEMGMNEVVRFYGDVKDVYAHLNEWNLFVYATTPSEGLGSVVAEAMANGLPCVLSDLPMLRELAPEEKTVAWFEPGAHQTLAEKILELYDDEDRRKELGQRARNHALNHFTVERFINDYIKIK